MNADFKAFRKANNLTQEELAAFLECTQGFVSQIERGITPAPSDVISKILAHAEWDTSSIKGSGDGMAAQIIIDDMDIRDLLSAIKQHGEELRRQGERLDRVLDMVSQRKQEAIAASVQTSLQKSPPLDAI